MAGEPPKVVVTLIHGTHARGAGWTEDDSDFARKLKKQLDIASSRTILSRFDWSGGNSHRDRATGAADLGEYIADIARRHPSSEHYLICHSHAGNVALRALEPELQDYVAGVVTLGTPFIVCRNRDIQPVLGALAWVLPGGAAFVAFVIALSISLGATTWIYDHAFSQGSMLNSLIALGALLTGVWIALGVGNVTWTACRDAVTTSIPAWIERRQTEIVAKYKAPHLQRTRVLVCWVAGDEATAYLGVLTSLTTWLHVVYALLRAVPLTFILLWFCLIFVSSHEYAVAWNEVSSDFALGCLASLGGLLLCVPALTIVPWMLRTHPLAFGGEALLDNLLVSISVQRLPDRASVSRLSEFVTSSPAAPLSGSGFRHSVFLTDEHTITAIAAWIAAAGHGPPPIREGTRADRSRHRFSLLPYIAAIAMACALVVVRLPHYRLAAQVDAGPGDWRDISPDLKSYVRYEKSLLKGRNLESHGWLIDVRVPPRERYCAVSGRIVNSTTGDFAFALIREKNLVRRALGDSVADYELHASRASLWYPVESGTSYAMRLYNPELSSWLAVAADVSVTCWSRRPLHERPVLRQV